MANGYSQVFGNSSFDNIEKRWIIYLAVITSSVLTLGGGLWLIKDSDKNEEEN